MQVAKIFQGEDNDNEGLAHPWDQADIEGWLDALNWKVGLILEPLMLSSNPISIVIS